ncbi:Fc receptor-like protein 5 isoform X2 [Genypterus blacodes]|uniref:Fc receptor-like protein 5 isoform X2 n=1 Tax=Genypterus blacodes TaxID=154954 RepID=UPI003F76A565
MEVTALCITLWIHVSMLTIPRPSYVHSSVAAVFPRIVPSRLQFFQYETISFTCEGFGTSATFRAMRKIKGGETICGSTVEMSAGSCTIQNAYPSESGEYWCEAAGGQRSKTLNIIITVGNVILESPALPVRKGDDVTLRCRHKVNSSDISANFYKDGNLVGNSSTGEMTIQNVSKSDEGLYRCSIPGSEESAESLMTVEVPHEETPRQRLTPQLYILVGSFVAALFVVLLLLLLRRLCCHQRTVSVQDGAASPHNVMYAVVTRAAQREPAAPSTRFSQNLNNDDYYSTIVQVAER